MFYLGTECTPPKVRVVSHIPMLKRRNPSGVCCGRGILASHSLDFELWLQTFLELSFTYGCLHAELLWLRERQVNLRQKLFSSTLAPPKRRGREVMMTAKSRSFCGKRRRQKPVILRADAPGKPIQNLQQSWRGLCIRAVLGSLLCLDCDAASWRGRGANAARTSASIAASSRTICGVQRPSARRAGWPRAS